MGDDRTAYLEEQVRWLTRENERLKLKLEEMPALLERTRNYELRCYQLEIEVTRAAERLEEQERRAEEAHRETQRLAYQDDLTGLANLNLMRHYLDLTCKAVARYERVSALLVLDLDNFKIINDAMGMKAGDEMLRLVADRLKTMVRDSDALCRLGEDEFLILLTEVSAGDEPRPLENSAVQMVANRIMNVLNDPFQIQGQAVYVTCSIGISLCPGDGATAQEMLEHAQSALAHAKEQGRDCYEFFTSAMKHDREERLRMEAQLRQALSKNEFLIEYQPIVELQKGKAKALGAEALIRWNHRLEGKLMPDRFLPIVEASGLIIPLGEWVLSLVSKQLKTWKQMSLLPFVTVNVSARQVMQSDLVEYVQGLFEEHQLSPNSIFLEVAEGLNALRATLVDDFSNRLDEAGFGLSIDDFGSGVSSLTRLISSRTRILKISPEIVAGCVADDRGAKVCIASIELAHSLGLTPLAKGVETAQQARFLANNRCLYAQGYFFSAPVEVQEITEMLQKKKTWKF